MKFKVGDVIASKGNLPGKYLVVNYYISLSLTEYELKTVEPRRKVENPRRRTWDSDYIEHCYKKLFNSKLMALLYD